MSNRSDKTHKLLIRKYAKSKGIKQSMKEYLLPREDKTYVNKSPLKK